MSDIEKENLEAHVELCSQRYTTLERRLTSVEEKIATLQTTIEESHLSTIKILIGTAGTVIASMLGVLIVILTK